MSREALPFATIILALPLPAVLPLLVIKDSVLHA